MVVFVDQNIYSNFIHFISWIWVPRGFCPTNWDQDFMKVGILEKNSPSFFWHRQESVRITRVGIYQLCFLSAKVSVEGKQPSFRVGGACEKNYHFAKNHQNWKTRNFMFVKNWKKMPDLISMLNQNRVLLNDATCWSTVLCFASVPVFSNTSPHRKSAFPYSSFKRFQCKVSMRISIPGNPICWGRFLCEGWSKMIYVYIYLYIYIRHNITQSFFCFFSVVNPIPTVYHLFLNICQ